MTGSAYLGTNIADLGRVSEGHVGGMFKIMAGAVVAESGTVA